MRNIALTLLFLFLFAPLAFGLSSSLDFNGSGDRASHNTDTLGDNEVSFSVWFYSDDDGDSNFPRLFVYPGYSMYFWRDEAGGRDNSISFSTSWSGTNGDWRTPENSMPHGEWIHLVATYDNSSTTNDAIIYKNSVSQSLTQVTGNPSGTPNDNNGTGNIGNVSGGNRSFNGRLRDFAQWVGYTLTQTDVQNLYNGMSPAVMAPNVLVPYYKMYGTDTFDYSGNGNTLTLTGTSDSSIDPGTLFEGGGLPL